MASDKRLQAQLAKRIHEAEKKSGLRDGATYRVRGENVRVRVHARFYPRDFWAVEQLGADGKPVPGSYRPLDADLKAKLEPWL